ncbi:MAG: TraM recognition domain-containing protein [Bacteroidota bacterium]
MQRIRIYAIILLIGLITVISLYALLSSDKKGQKVIGSLMILLAYLGGAYFFSPKWLYVLLVCSILVLPFLAYKFYNLRDNKGTKIILKHSKGQLEFFNAFVGWLVYGGAGSGKTASLGKPLLSEFMRLGFVFFIYDAKDNDYTNTAFWLKEKLNYPHPIYNIDIVNLSNGYRFNPIKKKLILDEMDVEELFTNTYMVLAKKTSLTEWDDKAKGILIASAYYLYYYHPDKFTYPHVLNFPLQLEPEELTYLFEQNPTCKTYAKALIDSKDSKPTQSSIMSTLSGVISSFAANKKITYVLTGDDFDFYLNDPEEPKSFSITNSFQYRNQISPFVALLFVSAVKRIKFGNTVPMVGFLDEGTTFKIQDLEQYPSELREYLFAMVILTQNPSKIEKMYSKADLRSLESNLQNHFYGRTKDPESAKKFSGMFAEIKERRKSYTMGKNQRKSVTTSTQDKEKYKPEFFKGLQVGRFVGSATESNVVEFDVRFKPYEGSKLSENPFVRMVTDEDIQSNYEKVINVISEIYTNDVKSNAIKQ